MRRACSVATVRRAEASAGVDEPVLMQRAASALAVSCASLLRAARGSVRGARVVGLVGSGNNGGDALWALARLAGRGARCVAVGDPDRMHTPGAQAALRSGAHLLAWGTAEADDELDRADLALDGIVGIGGSGGLRGPASAAVARLAAAGVPIVAVDVPSGVDSDTGEVPGESVRAAATVCFGVLKPGLLLHPGRAHAGAVEVVDIGLREVDLVPEVTVLGLQDLALARPASGAHKYARGVVSVVAGSRQYPGAALLAVGGARQSGVGMVAYGHPGAGTDLDPVVSLVISAYPDVVPSSGRRVDARCVGPGLGGGRDAADAVLGVLAEPEPAVVDASGLAVLAWQEGRRAVAERSARGWVTVLTPHAGEFARLGFDVSGGPLSAARRAADSTGAVILLKGPGSVVAAPGGAAHVDAFGGPELATAGPGDVLAGLVAGMLAEPTAAHDPASVARAVAGAVGLHGLAGRLAGAEGGTVRAPDVVAALPGALARARGAAGS